MEEMRQTLEVLNDLEERGFFSRYAIGGAMAALFYMEPFETEDLDILVLLPPNAHPLAPLGPLYEELKTRGCPEDGPYIVIEGVPVQFLPAYNPLIEEAIREAGEVDYETTTTRIPTAEHLAAIMIQTGRTKDRMRLVLLREQASLDDKRLQSLVDRYGLRERYGQWTQ